MRTPPAFLALNPSGLLDRHTSHFSRIFISQHYLLFTQVWCVMQTLESDVQDLIIILFIFPCLALPSLAPREEKREAQRHISTFVVSEWIVSSASACVSLGAWSVISTVFLLAAQFYYHQTEQGPSGPRDQRTLLNCFSWKKFANEAIWS